MTRGLIKFLLSNFTITFFIIGLLVSLVAIYWNKKVKTKTFVADILLKYFCLFAIGITYVYNAVFHIYFHALAARFIGWEDSPFQIEVGTASFGFGVVGLLAYRKNFGLRLAAVIGPSIFLLGAALGHVYQMVANHNFSPGNAGIIFYTDWLIPVIGFVLLYRSYTFDREQLIQGC
ncbi:MAG TPA: DUF6790 family protein [Puia sp.]|nr:DUF6790 family protein [Puia sp.]